MEADAELKTAGKSNQNRSASNKRLPYYYTLIGAFLGFVINGAFALLDKYSTKINDQSLLIIFSTILLSSLFGLILDIRASLEEFRDSLIKRNELQDRRARFLKSLEDCKFEEEKLTQLLNTVATIDSSNRYLFKYVNKIIDECRSDLHLAASYQIMEKGYPIHILLEFTQNAKESILATSTIVDAEFWNSNEGNSYWDKQINVIKRKVRVKRLFIIPAGLRENENSKLSRLKQIMEAQEKDGIEVKWVPDSVFDEGKPADNADFVIFDDVVMVNTVSNISHRVTGMHMNFKSADVREAIERFENYWRHIQAREVSRLRI